MMRRLVIFSFLIVVVPTACLLGPVSVFAAEQSEHGVWIGSNVPQRVWPTGWDQLSVDPSFDYANVSTSTGYV